MKNIFKNIKKWNSSVKLGAAIALGGALIVTMSVLYAANSAPEINLDSSLSTSSDRTSSVITTSSSTSQPIVDEKVEEIIRPYTVDCKVAHYFYDETDSSEIRQKAIVSIPGSDRTYMLSEGCDYNYDDKSFSIVASVSGTISDKLSDPTFGEIVILTHENGVKFIYASLSDIKVNKGQEVKQGDIIASSGTSAYTANLGSSLHFEVVKDGKNLNPEKLYSTSIEQL